MRKINPTGYTETFSGRGAAIVTVFVTLLFTFLFFATGAPLSAIHAVKYVYILPAVLICLFIFTDFSTNKKNKSKIEHSKYMLSCPFVVGDVTEIKRTPYFFGREFKERKGIRVKAEDCVFRVVASFYSPVTNKREVVTSERYFSNVTRYITDNKVNVHYSPDGEYWIDIV